MDYETKTCTTHIPLSREVPHHTTASRNTRTSHTGAGGPAARYIKFDETTCGFHNRSIGRRHSMSAIRGKELEKKTKQNKNKNEATVPQSKAKSPKHTHTHTHTERERERE